MGEEDVPAPHIVVRRWIPSLVWLVPIVAALVGLSLLVNAWRATGPRITIRFQTAQGLEVGKTLVKFRNVTIGHVSGITLSADHNSVLVTAELVKSASKVATEDAQFWVVRPRFGVGWVSGLETLMSGSFIGMEAGISKTPRRDFIGLENPPPLPHAPTGKRVVLNAQNLGSVSLGAPVYYKHFQVGRVIDEQLDANGRGVQVVLFVDAPNDRFITAATRFWNVSGIDMAMGADGMQIKTESLASVLAGGIEFANAPIAAEQPWAGGETDQFILYKDEATAMAPPQGEPHYVRMRFQQSVRGLAPGAPVEFIGVNIGSVLSVDLDYDVKHQQFPVIVTALVYPQRMGRAYQALEQQGATASDDKMARLVGQWVARGLRAQPRLGNLLTGQLYLALDFIPGAGPVKFSSASRPVEIPTANGSNADLQLRIASIVDKIDKLPLNDVARHLDQDLTSAHQALDQLNGDVLPEAAGMLNQLRGTAQNVDRMLRDDAPWRESVDDTLREARESLRSLRSLTDYLDRHPEALIRGRRAQSPGVEAPGRPKEAAP